MWSANWIFRRPLRNLPDLKKNRSFYNTLPEKLPFRRLFRFIHRSDIMKQILAFGDSNTWGLVPGSRSLKRYPWGVRWTSLLQEMGSGYHVAEEGLCGRTTVFEDELRPGRKGVNTLDPLMESQYPVDAVILMLGTNDCKAYYNASAYVIGKGIERCLDTIEKYVPAEKILLISPMTSFIVFLKSSAPRSLMQVSRTVAANLPEMFDCLLESA